ncbi:caspase family protein [Leptolyngbya sp. PCC 6406]|uniref:caspase family protein n=1 Tax=Leptolyngbya sp. PCC 6406 TaxID=1173264 RepID=UPI0002AB9E97|nr:caspase family protein [Leptolyngbya sp. PCC 6406]
MKRRHFLQFAGSALAATGLSQTRFLSQAHRYGKALAQGTPRKLALLIGVNQYTDPLVSNLNGCLTDVEMHYQLLVNRFGFNPSDVLQLTDATPDMLPTRANILQAFEEHLIQQAQDGDVVVVHYSGHGSRVTDPTPTAGTQCPEESALTGLNGTLVPRDARVVAEKGSELAVTDIMGRSLFLLTERLQTENITLVLDSCFAGASTRGNAKVRAATGDRLSRQTGFSLVPSEEELEQQRRWLAELEWDEAEFSRRRSRGIAKGVAMGSASCNQEAYELPYDEGSQVAGAFTYLLTSYLWQMPTVETARAIQTNLVRSTRIAVQGRGSQVPTFEEKPSSNNLSRPLYFNQAPPAIAPFAEAVVKSVTGSQIEFWLGGLSYQTLKLAREGTVYTVLDPATTQALGEVVLRSRNGLLAYGELGDGSSVVVTPGMLLREKVAAIADPILRIGVDSSLESERQATETALGTVLSQGGSNRVQVLPVDQRSDVEYVLARVSEDLRTNLSPGGMVPPLGTVGLFTADLSRLVPNSIGAVNETAPAAVIRLRPRLVNLLVNRVLQDLASTNSDLQVQGQIASSRADGPVIPISGRSSSRANERQFSTEVSLLPYRVNDRLTINVTNQESEAVYLSFLVIDGNGNIVVLHPANWDSPDEAARIDAGESVTIPRVEDGVEFRVTGAGFVELLTIMSRVPLRGLLRSLQTLARNRGDRSGAVGFGEGDPLNLLTNLLGDVDQVSRSGRNIGVYQIGTQDTAVDSSAIAAFSTVIEIVEE